MKQSVKFLILLPKTYAEEATFIAESWSPNVLVTKLFHHRIVWLLKKIIILDNEIKWNNHSIILLHITYLTNYSISNETILSPFFFHTIIANCIFVG